MDHKNLIVVARVKARAGKEEELRRELSGLVGPTRSEPGCISYDLHRSVEDPNVFMFYEKWRSREDLDRHLEKAYLKAWINKSVDLLDGPTEVTLWNIVP
jgi:quinol monooxygenase YgiN